MDVGRKDKPVQSTRSVAAASSWRKTATHMGVAVALVLSASGCGSNGHGNGSAGTAAKAGTGVTAPAAVPARLHIVSPRAGASTGATVTVHVAVTGAVAGTKPLRYLLDGKLARFGATRLTFHELAPGRHRLTVSLATNHSVRAARVFTVRMPVATAPVTSTPSTHTETTREAPPRTETQATTPHTSSTPEPPPRAPEGGIPQGGAGDHDSDNSGGPSDGDGNV